MSWFETALAMATTTTIEVTVKNTIAQILKEFYGYGPRTAVRCMVQGPAILHATRTVGSAILDELAARTAGQTVLQYNNQLLVERYRERLGALSRLALRAELQALFSDFDPASGLVLGCALLDRPINRDFRTAPPHLAAAVRDALREALSTRDDLPVFSGPGFFWVTLPPGPEVPAPTGGPEAADALTQLARWRAWRDELAGRVRDRCHAAGAPTEALFVAADTGTLLVGGLLPAPN